MTCSCRSTVTPFFHYVFLLLFLAESVFDALGKGQHYLLFLSCALLIVQQGCWVSDFQFFVGCFTLITFQLVALFQLCSLWDQRPIHRQQSPAFVADIISEHTQNCRKSPNICAPFLNKLVHLSFQLVVLFADWLSVTRSLVKSDPGSEISQRKPFIFHGWLVGNCSPLR